MAKFYTVSEKASASQMVLKLRRGEDVRREMVAKARGLMASNHFDDEAKLEVAIDRLLDELTEGGAGNSGDADRRDAGGTLPSRGFQPLFGA